MPDFEKILHPRKFQLFIFGILVTPLILFGLYYLSFSWFIPFEDHLITVYIIAFSVLLIAFAGDRTFQIKLSHYIIVAIVLLTLYAIISYPLRTWMISQSEKQGEQIAKLIEEYKAENGYYPENLNIDYFKNTPKRSYLGTRFRYEKSFDEKKKTEEFYIEYKSFYGYFGTYNTERRKWKYYD